MALVDRDLDVKPHLEIAPATTTFDTYLDALAESVTILFETLTNRVLEEQDLTHRFNGNGKHVLVLREFPVSQVTRVAIDATWGFLTPEDTTSYYLDNEVFLVRQNVWPEGIRNIEIDTTAGYAPDDVPEDLRYTALLAIEFFYHGRTDHRLGVTARSKMSESLTFTESLPKTILDMLDPYRRKRAMADLLERVGG